MKLKQVPTLAPVTLKNRGRGDLHETLARSWVAGARPESGHATGMESGNE